MIPYGAIEEWFGAIYQGVDYSWRFEVSTFGRLRNAKTKHIYSFGYGDGGYLQACVSIMVSGLMYMYIGVWQKLFYQMNVGMRS